tara:strand:- start:13367 stop:14218 length:852 start_codon:yes stop_codon:yes gene_type:complete
MIAKGIRFSKNYWSNLKWWLIDLVWMFKPNPVAKDVINSDYSIGVVTYVNRYEIHFLPLIKRLVTVFPDTQIVIAVNGYYDAEVQQRYLKQISALLNQYKNVDVITYDTGQSLSKLWNQLIIHSKTDKTLIFNDDIKIASNFRGKLERSGILNESCGLINASWSHFLMSKQIIQKNGWFDERFPGVGYEDQDFEIRLVLNGIVIKDYCIGGLKNLVFKTTDFSYGENIETDFEKYSSVNGKVFFKKWEVTQTDTDKFTWVRIIQAYAKQIEGMETPNFYLEKN